MVFYDGVNDVYSSYQNGIPGLPQNVVQRMKPRSQRPERTSRLRRLALLTYTGELTEALASRIFNLVGGPEEPGWQPPRGPEAAQLDRRTIETMLENIRIVRALEDDYGFRSFFYWQPAVYTKAVQSDDEKHAIPKDTAFGNMYLRVTELIAEQDTIVDLSHIFDDEPSSVFIDEFHISESGNAEVAESIAEDVLAYLGAAEDARVVAEDARAVAEDAQVVTEDS